MTTDSVAAAGLLELLRDLAMGGGGLILSDRDGLDPVKGLKFVPPEHASPRATFTTGFLAAIDPHITELEALLDEAALRNRLCIPHHIDIDMSPYLAAQFVWLVVEARTFAPEESACCVELCSARMSEGTPRWVAALMALREVCTGRLAGRERMALVWVPGALRGDAPQPPGAP